MPNSTDRSSLATAAVVAIEPLIDFFIEIGLSSPEVESLLRPIRRTVNPTRASAIGCGRDSRPGSEGRIGRLDVAQVIEGAPQGGAGTLVATPLGIETLILERSEPLPGVAPDDLDDAGQRQERGSYVLLLTRNTRRFQCLAVLQHVGLGMHVE